MKKHIVLISLCSLLTGCYNGLRIGIKPVDTGDTVPPYINLNTYEFVTAVGMPIDFSNITAYDDVDGLTPVEVKGRIDYSKPGEYYPALCSQDTSGNAVEVDIYVVVVEALEPTAEAETVLPEEPIEIGCSMAGAKRHDLPCDKVVPEDLEEYDKLFYGQEGLEMCLNGKNEKAEDAPACEVIRTNSGSFWGYGRKRKTG